jgi:hypothetical protein
LGTRHKEEERREDNGFAYTTTQWRRGRENAPGKLRTSGIDRANASRHPTLAMVREMKTVPEMLQNPPRRWF